MAPARSDRQKEEVAAFVNELYKRSDFASWAEFATQAGVHPVNLSNWQLGKAVPDGWNLFSLIKAAGGVSVAREAAGASASTQQAALFAVVERLAAIVDRLEEAAPPNDHRGRSGER